MSNYQNKLDSVRELMVKKNIDLAIFGAGPNLQYLTEADIDWRRFTDLGNLTTIFFVPLDDNPVLLLGPYTHSNNEWQFEVYDLGLFEEPDSAIKKILNEITNPLNQIAIDNYISGSTTLVINEQVVGENILSTNGLLNEQRAIKYPEEINHLRSVANLTDMVMEDIVDGIEEGDTMKEINLKIETLGRQYGATDISFPSTTGFCKSGKGDPDHIFNYESDEGLEKGTSIAFDVGFVKSGFCSDWGRSFYYGNPPKYIENAYSTLVDAVSKTVDAIGDDIHKTNEIFPYIEKICAEDGYSEYLKNRHPNGVVGHQIGVEVHEDPWLRPENSCNLEEGMVLCIEPKLMRKNDFYLRIEDMIYIGEESAESLTKFNRDKFVI